MDVNTVADSLKQRIKSDLNDAMRSRDKRLVQATRFIMAAIKQQEIDQQISELEDPQTLTVLNKLAKQRRDALQQYTEAGRQDLADQEAFEITVLDKYLPTALPDQEIDALIESTLTTLNATTPRDMGKVMSILRSQVQGRADMSQVSAMVKERLS